MIKVITVGSLKEKYLVAAEEEYLKRLKKHTPINIIEIKEDKYDYINNEGKKFLEKIKEDEYVIALEIFGEELSSLEFAEKLDNLLTYGKSNITFLIGGSNGLSEDVLERANMKLSFSKMTFPHQFARIILLEQLYRAYKIMKNEPYHK